MKSEVPKPELTEETKADLMVDLVRATLHHRAERLAREQAEKDKQEDKKDGAPQ